MFPHLAMVRPGTAWPNGAYCLFRLNPQGSRQGRVVLVQHRGIWDNEFGGHYTVKVYESEKEQLADWTWRHRRVVLKPDSDDPGFEVIVLEGVGENDVRVVGEMVEVLSEAGTDSGHARDLAGHHSPLPPRKGTFR